MSPISAVTNTTAATAADTARAGLSDNYQTFLTLLTAQIQNQDPLKPMDSAEFTNQLVQYSGVEQQIQQNKNLENLIALQQSNTASSAVGYLGKDAVAITDDAALLGGKAAWNYSLPADATTIEISVLDSAGRVVATGAGDPKAGSHIFEWDGQTIAGQQRPDGGIYSLRVTASNGNGDTITPTISQKGRISGVDLSGSMALLILNGTPVDITSIKSLSTGTVSGYQL